MIITKDHIFLHIPKTGGKSIARAYKQKHDIDIDIHNYEHINKTKLPNPHIRASEVRSIVGSEVYDNAYKFAVIRNPLDRMVSFYHYGQNKLRKGIFNTFEDFIKYVTTKEVDPSIGLWNNAKIKQTEYLDDKVDKIVYFENGGVNKMFKILQLGEPLHVNKSAHEDFMTYYDEETMELMLDYFSDEIKRFYS